MYQDFLDLLLEGSTMPTNPKQQRLPESDKPAKAAKPWQGAPRGYVNADISKAEREDFLAWYERGKGGLMWAALCEMLDNGYRVSAGEGDKGFKASATNVEGPMGSRGMCLSGYGSDAQKALAALLYKHEVKLSGDWGEGEAEEDTYFR